MNQRAIEKTELNKILSLAAEYAVFEAECSVFDEKISEELKNLWNMIFDEWFSLSEKNFDEEKMCFEFYKGEKAYIYVPIK